ncbi:helix-turn-helix domain-containing protein [Alloiococcus sp. CFN-8]|uniref:helix-turn-helix domain-containing protein n=1 Tax=Alloiococcus sp. CFN-8 TaxID=3416081 RepID=UPI003CE95F48
MDIGYKIKQLRLQKGLTLEELASRCELTKGFLSQLERNLTSPSISTLDDILEVLGSTLSDFFLEEKEEKVTFQGKDFYVDEREEYTVNWIVPNSQKNEMEPILLELLPGAKSFEVNPNDGEEFGYVLEGRITLVNGNNEYVLKKGETFYLNGKYHHFIRNDKKSVAKILWISTPPLF